MVVEVIYQGSKSVSGCTSSTLGTFFLPPHLMVFLKLARHTAAVPWHGLRLSAAAADRYSTRNGLRFMGVIGQGHIKIRNTDTPCFLKMAFK